jgi:Gpi18-like mannosyltransferase
VLAVGCYPAATITFAWPALIEVTWEANVGGQGLSMSLPGLSGDTDSARLPGTGASSAIRNPAEALSRLRSSTTAIAIAVYLGIRIISLRTFGVLLPLRSFHAIRAAGIWSYLTRNSDAAWYSRIAQHGYQLSAPGTFHFYPGYPAAIDAIAWIPGMGIARAGIVITFVAGLAAAAGLAHLGMRLTGDSRISVLLVALWAVAPAAMVLSMVYSEALLCALVVWAMVAVVDRRWITAGILTMLAGTVHSSAVAMMAALAIAALAAIIESARTGRLTVGAWLRPVAAVVISPLGLIGFWLFVSVGLHFPGGWVAAESGSGQGINWGVTTWHDVINTIGAPNAFNLLFVLALLAGVGLAAWTCTERIPAYLKVYVLITVLLALLTGPGFLGSKPRILLPALLLGFPLAKILAPSRTYVLIPLIIVLAAASAWFTLIATTVGIPP